jgi:sugar phosphate permease
LSQIAGTIRGKLAVPRTGDFGSLVGFRRVRFGREGQVTSGQIDRGRIHYAWVVFAVTFFTLLAAAGFRSTPGVLMVPLGDEFGWSRATVGLAVSVNLVLFGFSGPFAAAAMLRWGIRKVVIFALATIALGAFLTTRMQQPWQMILLWGVVVGLGAGCMASVFAATVANRWFVQKRGLVVGWLTAASATGQLVFLPLLATLASGPGWRYVSLTIALSALVAIIPVALFVRDFPSDMGLRPYGAMVDDPPVPHPTGNPITNAFNGLRMASRSRDFWLLAGTFFICGFSTNGLIGTHLIPASMDHGMTEVAAASMLALVGIFDVIGTVASGWLTDRWDSRKLLFAYYALRGLSLILLPLAFGAPQFAMILFIVFYGLDWVATVPPTVALSSDLFGRQQGPIIYGWVFSAHQIGAAVAATGAGLVRGATGDYLLAFLAAGLACLVAAVMSLAIGRRPSVAPPVQPIAAGGPLVR